MGSFFTSGRIVPPPCTYKNDMINKLLFGFSIFGFLGLSLLCPLLASLLKKFQSRGTPGPVPGSHAANSTPVTLTIAIPAHNEEAHIGKTLSSIEAAIAALERSLQGKAAPGIRVVVGLDGCADRTGDEARAFACVEARDFPQNLGKWRTLESLLSGISSDWTILADSGIQWPESFLIDFLSAAERNPMAIAIAPSYKPLQPGLLSRLVWGFEVFLKKCEGWSGGPVSLHGATLGYKTAALKFTLRRLSGTHWLNDDVVIPLMVRSIYPQGVVLYPMGQVQDAGVRQDQVDFGRRRRILRGNLQWVRSLWPMTFRLNPIAAVLATRRVFRLLWAYWFVFLAVSAGLTFHSLVIPALVTAGILMAISGSVRQLACAAMVSLLSPWYILRFPRPSEGSWS